MGRTAPIMGRIVRPREKPYIHPSPVTYFARAERTRWVGLQSLDQVTVHEGKRPSYEAVVDVITEDRTVVWVLPVTNGHRRAFHFTDDVDIILIPRKRSGRVQ